MIDAVDLPAVSGVHDLYLTYHNDLPGKPAASALKLDWLHFGRKLEGSNRPGYAEAKKIWWELLTRDLPGIPVMMDNPADMHRVSHVFERGNWLVKGKAVEPDVPHSLNPLPAGCAAQPFGAR